MSELKELPDDWQLLKLEAICKADTGTRDPSLEDKSFIYVDISSVDNVTKRIVTPQTLLGKDAPSRARKVIRTNDVIVSTTRPNLNAVALVPPDLDGQICSTGFCVLRANSDLDPKYLFSFVQSARFIDSLTNLVSGALYPAVNDGQVFSQLIPLPLLLSEQKMIASRLSRQMEEIERMRRTAERQLEAAKAMRSAILRSVFESEESSDWKQEKLKKICILITDGSHFTPNYVFDGVPFLSVKDVRETGISFANTRFISTSEHTELIKRCHPKKGDVLYTKVGTTGIAKAIDSDKEFSIFVSLALLRPNHDKVLPEYLEYALNSPIGREQAQNMTQGIGNQNLVLEDIENIELPIAPPDLQLDIVKKLRHRLAEADSRITIAERSLEAIKALPKAYLREVFGIFEPPELDERPDIDDEAEEWEEEDEQED